MTPSWHRILGMTEYLFDLRSKAIKDEKSRGWRIRHAEKTLSWWESHESDDGQG